MSTKKWKNPFYTLLIPVGAAFCITGFAYCLMAFGEVNAGTLTREAAESSAPAISTDHPLYVWLRANGTWAMLIELAVLAVLTVGAIATDDWWGESSGKSEE